MRKPKTSREEQAREDTAKVRLALEAVLASRQAKSEAQAGVNPAMNAVIEQDLFRYDLAYRLRAWVCREPRRCTNHRCRRLGHCRDLLKLTRLSDACRARMAPEAGGTGAPAAGHLTKAQRKH